MLEESTAPLCEQHDLVMFDLDGVIYVGGRALPGVPERVERLAAGDVHLAYVTNNASRTADAVADHLAELGVPATAEDVVTSAQAAARVLLERHGPAARLLVLGGTGLTTALADVGLVPVTDVASSDCVAIVTGYGPEVLWKDVMRAAVLIRDGLPWVASNTDLTIPTAYGLAPGHGVLVRTLADFAGVHPTVAGKPQRPLLEETVRRVGGERPLMVGDRLDTDIEGARNVGVPSLLVMTGVTGLAELTSAGPELRPTYLSATLEGLFEVHRAPEVREGEVALGGWVGSVSGGRLEVTGQGEPDDWWRVVAVAAWQHLDETGTAVDLTGAAPPQPRGEDEVG